MELKSNQLSKKTIDCLSTESLFITGEQFYFAELCMHNTAIDYFESEDYYDVQDYRDILGWCTSILGRSPSARIMLKEACDQDWKVTLDDLGGADYCIDVEEKLIIFDNNSLTPHALACSLYFRNTLLCAMVKALRDIWQEKRYGGFDELYSPEYVLLMERVRAADLDVLTVLVSWELRSEEYQEAWRHMIGSEIGDMAMCFSGHLERDPSSQFNGQSLLAVFKQWFRDTKRIDMCDHDALEYMDDVLAMTTDTNPFGRKKPSKMSVEVLSCLPDKTAYLQGKGADILGDPIYSAVNNVINQTHLFHIMYDLEACVVEDVPFRDAELARKIFPDQKN